MDAISAALSQYVALWFVKTICPTILAGVPYALAILAKSIVRILAWGVSTFEAEIACAAEWTPMQAPRSALRTTPAAHGMKHAEEHTPWAGTTVVAFAAATNRAMVTPSSPEPPPLFNTSVVTRSPFLRASSNNL